MNEQTYPDRPTLAKWNELAGRCRIASGTYTGNGAYSDYYTSITFPFEPKLVMIYSPQYYGLCPVSTQGWRESVVWLPGIGSTYVNGGGIWFRQDGCTLSMNANSAASQLNENAKTYCWIAFG